MSSWKQQVLVLSLVLNVALLALFFFFVVRENRLFLPYKPSIESELSLLEQIRKNPEDSLIQQFAKSSEFTLIHTLFARADENVSKGMIMKLLIEGNQQILEQFVAEQQKGSDLSPRKRQEFLLEYVSVGSKTAAYLLVLLEPEFVRLLPNPEVLHLFDLMDEATPEAIHFVEAILEEKRTPAVHDRALQQLVKYTGESEKELAARYDRYLNNEDLRPVFRQQVPITQTERTHIVQPGESLWLIAKRYKVDMKKIMETNDLQSTVLKPGQMLKIPLSN